MNYIKTSSQFILLTTLIAASGCHKNESSVNLSTTETQKPSITIALKDSLAINAYKEDDLTLHGLEDLTKNDVHDFSNFEIRNAFNFENMNRDLTTFEKNANVFRMHFHFNQFNQGKSLGCSLEVIKGNKLISKNAVVASEGEDVIFYPNRTGLQFKSTKETSSLEDIHPTDKVDINDESLFLLCNIDGEKSFDLELRKDLVVKDSSVLKSFSIYNNKDVNYQILNNITKTISWDYNSLSRRLNQEDAAGYYGALRFEGAFYTHGNFYKIDAKKLMFKNSVINSFDSTESMPMKPQMSLFPREGLTGGVLQIKTVQVSGGLTISLSGKDGEKGKNGEDGKQDGIKGVDSESGDNGKDGTNGGDCGSLVISYKDKESFSFSDSVFAKCTNGKGGIHGNPGSAPVFYDENEESYEGNPGKAGNDGSDGNAGFHPFNLPFLDIAFMNSPAQ